MNCNEARNIFLDYFKKHNHRLVRSSSLVPDNDPTLLFTNAGMVQFKRVFIGEDKREYSTAVTSQKCVRAGGKHNDLENVGYTARHHTFFEMLGNFSFGDYFKEDAIKFAWDLLLNGYGLPEDKLWISIYLDDDEAYDIWHEKMGVPADRIVRLGEKDNFWAMGDTGPCGPCSEIHIDRGAEFGCDSPECAVGCDCDRYLEIWNLVFMQFNRDEEGKLEPLPKPSIDTGMGLERILSVVQDVPTNYDTDLFLPVMNHVEKISGKKLYDNRVNEVAMKVIADHSRSAAFLISDGVLPSNEGRGYVLRRIMRRAIRYGRNIDLVKPFLKDTVNVVIDIMKDAYPELEREKAFILNVVENEEARFSETLDKGLKLLEETLSEMKEAGKNIVPGEVVFRLYDTFGFPVDIIRDVVRESSIEIDMDGFNSAMEKQREQSRSTVTFASVGEAYRELSSQGVKTEFCGYKETEVDSDLTLLVVDGEAVSSAEAGQDVEVVTLLTPFYGESGGQAGDSGTISGEGFSISINDTVKDPTGHLYIHRGKVEEGKAVSGSSVKLSVDLEKRKSTALNHTATHILHTSLREVLGDHVKQAGSLVSHDRLRFDFTHFSQADAETLAEIEALVNSRIRENATVDVNEMSAEEAFKTGATALFEEKYGDRVRVVSLSDFSKEFCGGTHTERTGDIGVFRILSETGIAAGVRRIEALTGPSAMAYTQERENLLKSVSYMVKSKPEALAEKVEKLLKDQKTLEKEIEKLKAEMAAKSLEDTAGDTREVAGVKVIAKKVEVEKPAELRDLADKFKDRIGSGIVILGAESGGKALLIVIVTKDLTKKYKAGDIVKQVASFVGGGGGGRPDMAQAGGSKPENLDIALEKAYAVVEEM